MADRPLYRLSRRHLDIMRGPYGIWQHAAGSLPNEAFGYCTDDVARALQVDLLHRHELGWDAVRGSAWQSLEFLRDAFDPATGRFRNFRAADGSWLDEIPSEDSQGRAVLALGLTIADAPEAAATVLARELFARALPAVRGLTALRGTASALLGCASALEGGCRGETQRTFERLALRLQRACAVNATDMDWPWPEPSLTYENALLPRALIVAGARLHDGDMRRTGLRMLDWLIRVQTTPEGTFSPIGSSGWWPCGGVRSTFDQQPIEATSLLLAAEAAYADTGDPNYLRVVERAYGWFLGDNDIGVPVAEVTGGGCFDGLTPDGVNRNQGAESTLMWLMALEHVRGARAVAASYRAGRGPERSTYLAGARP